MTSDAHRGLVAAIGAALPGAGWQRCRTHYLRNLLAKVPQSAQPWVATLVRTIFDQPDTDAVKAQYTRVLDMISEKFPDAAEHLTTPATTYSRSPPSRVGGSRRDRLCTQASGRSRLGAATPALTGSIPA